MEILWKVKREAERRNLSPRTIETYSFCIKKFLLKTKKDPMTITKKDVNDYLYFLSQKKKSGSTLNVYLNSIKFFLEDVLGRRLIWNKKFSKVPKKLPEFLTKEETVKLISKIKNKKHQLAIALMYGAGLRVSELLNLQVKDLDFSSNFGWVRQGKGRKDRAFIIPLSIKLELKNFMKNKKINEIIFSRSDGNPLSRATMQAIIKKAAKKSKIKKNVHPHTLRHSFATHLIQNGYDVNSVQSLLGHNSAQTTMIYVHLASPNLINVKSPLDNLEKPL